MMNNSIWGVFFSFAYVFSFIGLAEALRRRGLFTPAMTRKIVHIGVSHWWLFAMYFLRSPFYASIGPIAFILINAASFKFHLFKGMEDPEPSKNLGTVYFPISLLILVQLAWRGYLPLWSAGVGILIMGWGDGLAAIVGSLVRSPSGTVFGSRKSVAGSSAMVIASFLVVFIMTVVFDSSFSSGPALFAGALYRAAGTAIVAAFLEAATPWGIDNITVPLGSALYFHFVSQSPLNAAVVIGFTLSAAVAYLSWQRRAVTTEGALAGLGLGTLIFTLGGIGGLTVLFGFFASSTILGRFKKHKREALKLQDVVVKGDRRDSIQVLANCGVGVLSAIGFAATGQVFFFFAFGVSFAAATADTWASEIGVLNPKPPVSILGGKTVEPGVSGGVSLLGFFSSLMGALFIAALLWAERIFFQLGFTDFAPLAAGLGRFWEGKSNASWNIAAYLGLITAGGFLGSVIDSLLGATLQAQYRCSLTGRRTERPSTSGTPNVLVRGLRWMTNDMVNFLAILFASAASGACFVVFGNL